MKNIKMLLIALCLLGVFSQTGCALFCTSVKRLQDLEIGMTKAQVKQTIGEPSVARGAIRSKDDKLVEVWVYNLARPGCIRPQSYLLRFQDSKLVQWGQSQDWLRQPDSVQKTIYENETGRNKTGLY
jgi:hypothetical protein